MDKTRKKNLDVARGIAIILMVIGHCDGTGKIMHFVSLFHMIVFIFVSGTLYKDIEFNNLKDLVKFIIKKTKKLYLFYLKWELIFFFLKNGFIKIGFYSTSILYGGKQITANHLNIDFVKNIFKIIFGMGREPFCGAFWFIISLIFIIIIFSTINYIIKKFNSNTKVRFFLIICCFSLGMLMFYIPTINIKRLSPAFSMILFYYLGYLNKDEKYIRFDNKLVFIVSLVVLIILNNYSTIGLNSNNIVNPVFYICSSLCGIYFIMFLAKYIENINFLNYIGKNTLPIIALHFVSFKIVQLIQYSMGLIEYEDISLLNGAYNNNYWIIIYTIVGVSIPLAYDYILKMIKGDKI